MTLDFNIEAIADVEPPSKGSGIIRADSKITLSQDAGPGIV